MRRAPPRRNNRRVHRVVFPAGVIENTAEEWNDPSPSVKGRMCPAGARDQSPQSIRTSLRSENRTLLYRRHGQRLVAVRWPPAPARRFDGLRCHPSAVDDEVITLPAAVLTCGPLEEASGSAMLTRYRDSFVHQHSFGVRAIDPSRRLHATRRYHRVILGN